MGLLRGELRMTSDAVMGTRLELSLPDDAAAAVPETSVPVAEDQ
jgi:hypothetical protein